MLYQYHKNGGVWRAMVLSTLKTRQADIENEELTAKEKRSTKFQADWLVVQEDKGNAQRWRLDEGLTLLAVNLSAVIGDLESTEASVLKTLKKRFHGRDLHDRLYRSNVALMAKASSILLENGFDAEKPRMKPRVSKKAKPGVPAASVTISYSPSSSSSPASPSAADSPAAAPVPSPCVSVSPPSSAAVVSPSPFLVSLAAISASPAAQLPQAVRVAPPQVPAFKFEEAQPQVQQAPTDSNPFADFFSACQQSTGCQEELVFGGPVDPYFAYSADPFYQDVYCPLIL
eukprot:m51a1_g5593 hypothetical protein (287) ;mRNA; f:659800-660831